MVSQPRLAISVLGNVSVAFGGREIRIKTRKSRALPLLTATPRLIENLLAGLDDLDPSFRVWLMAKRQTFHDRILRALEAGLNAPKVDLPTRRQLAEAILSLDPTHEEACRRLMQ